jgi:hypothetical protein
MRSPLGGSSPEGFRATSVSTSGVVRRSGADQPGGQGVSPGHSHLRVTDYPTYLPIPRELLTESDNAAGDETVGASFDDYSDCLT